MLASVGGGVLWWGACAVPASNLDTVGVSLLQQVQPGLTGSGIRVGQPEANVNSSGLSAFEVNPSAVGQPANLFSYASADGMATGFPNAVGVESGHADTVGNNYYGSAAGVAPGVSQVDNCDADYFYTNYISGAQAISDKVVNQSFVFGSLSPADEALVWQTYDDYAAGQGVLFVSGAGNGGAVMAPASSFNGLGVGAVDINSSVGPTDDGRCKPDLTAPGGATSYSTPYVAGSAAVLLQAAARGDGGPDPVAASDLRTLKALLLNGTVKPPGWTNGPSTPLDARYGAGTLNLYNSWHQMAAGRHMFIEASSSPAGGAHPPGGNPANEPGLAGWDFQSMTNAGEGAGYSNRVYHYYVDLSPNSGGTFTLTSTLVWNRQVGRSNLNNLDLFLYNTANGTLVGCSTSAVDNVEHVFIRSLPKGRYDLQVVKNGGSVVSAEETYALAYEFFNLSLSVGSSNGAVVLSWPIAPAGFNLLTTTNLGAPNAWTAVGIAPSVVNGSNVVVLGMTNSARFFRLAR